jgi:hypothetical protein
LVGLDRPGTIRVKRLLREPPAPGTGGNMYYYVDVFIRFADKVYDRECVKESESISVVLQETLDELPLSVEVEEVHSAIKPYRYFRVTSKNAVGRIVIGPAEVDY